MRLHLREGSKATDLVNEQRIGGAVVIVELREALAPMGCKNIVNEMVAIDPTGARTQTCCPDLVLDRARQMSLAVANFALDEQQDISGRFTGKATGGNECLLVRAAG